MKEKLKPCATGLQLGWGRLDAQRNESLKN